MAESKFVQEKSIDETTVTKKNVTMSALEEPVVKQPDKPLTSPAVSNKPGLKLGTYEFVIRTLDEFSGPTYHKFKVIVKQTRTIVKDVTNDFALSSEKYDVYYETYESVLKESISEKEATTK